MHSQWCPCAICNPIEPREQQIKRLELYIQVVERQRISAIKNLAMIEENLAKYQAALNELKAN